MNTELPHFSARSGEDATGAAPLTDERGDWMIFNGAGAVEASDCPLADVREALTPARLTRGWSAVCFVKDACTAIVKTQSGLDAAMAEVGRESAEGK